MYKTLTEIEVLFINNFFTPKFLDILFVSFFPNGPYIQNCFNSVYIRLCSDFCGEGLRIFALFFSNELGVSIFGLLVFGFVVLSLQIAETYIKEVSFPPPKPEQKINSVVL